MLLSVLCCVFYACLGVLGVLCSVECFMLYECWVCYVVLGWLCCVVFCCIGCVVLWIVKYVVWGVLYGM